MPLGSHTAYLRGPSNTAQTTAGTTQATAAPMLADHVSVPTATASEGVILPSANASDWFTVSNDDQDTDFLVYPPVGAQFNGKTANEAVTLPRATACLFIFTSPLKIMAIFS